MSATVFVDTNVLVYSRDASEPQKQPRAQAWREALWRARAGRLSTQVLQEYYVTVTRKLKPGLSRELARREIGDLFHWQPIELSAGLLEEAWEVEDRYQLSFWDSLIVAAARVSGSRWLLTEDLQAGARFGELRVINPFQTRPDEILK